MAYKYEEDFKRIFPESDWEPSGGSNFLTDCPFHEHSDSKTFAIDFETGLFTCMNPDCGVSGKGKTKLIQMLRRMQGVEAFEEALVKNRISPESDPEILDFLRNERGISIETARKHFLAGVTVKTKDRETGAETLRKALLIPVFDEDGEIIAGRKYLLPKYREKGIPKIKFAWSDSPVTLYPNLPDSDTIILVEGELDAILLKSMGFNACTTTGGQGGASFLPFISALAGRTVYICFDCDRAGREGMQKVGEALSRFPDTQAFAVDLKLEDGEDVTDYFVAYGFTKDEFQRRLNKAEPIVPAQLDTVPMSKLGPQHVNQTKMVQGRVIGQSGVNKFLWPSLSVLSCKGMDAKICRECPLNGAQRTVHIEPGDPEVMNLMEQPLDKQKNFLAAKAFVPFVGNSNKRCNFWGIDEEKSSREMAVPVFIESTDEDTADFRKELEGYVTTEKGATNLKSGREAVFKMTPVQDRNDGKFMFIAEDVIPVQDDLDTFKVSKELNERLKVFQGNPKEKIPEISRTLNENVFRFKGRDELVTAYDLLYHSILRFQNPNAPGRLVKGWAEGLIIGDPGEGKSQLAIDMTNHYGLGAYQDASTATPGGLTVTTVQMSNKWVFRDGLMPLNDRRLVFIDEFNKMSGEDLGRLNTSRSSGEISASSAAGSYKKDARTRMMWITNPKDGQRIEMGRDAGEYPVKLIGDLFTDRGSQDRLDFAIIVLRDDPKPEFEVPPDGENPYIAKLSRSLILWAWTRRPDQVYFQDDAIKEIRLVSDRLRRTFWHENSEIELINSGERTTERIMRLSASVAARVYSTADGENLFVTKEHVQFVEEFLVSQYKKMEFDQYIEALDSRKTLNEDDETPKEDSNETEPKPKEEKPKTGEEAVNEAKVIEILSSDKILFDGLDKGHYDFIMEREREKRAVINFLYGKRYVRSLNGRQFSFTKAFYQELEPRLVNVKVQSTF